MSKSLPTSNRRRSIMIGVIVVTLLGVIHLGMLVAGLEAGWFAWTTPFAFWGIAMLTYKRELQRRDDAA